MNKSTQPLRIIELFSGIGSQTQALFNLGIKHTVAAISEIDRFALISYAALHGQRGSAPNNLGDIRKIQALPQADLWTYSFPCQDISLAGKQAGIKEGTRSGLLFEVERLLKVAAEQGTLPKYLLLENVKALTGKKFKPDFDRWLAFLEALGYTNYWKVLNTRDYCIPQNRERVFCVSIRGEHEPYKFPEKRELRLRLKDMLDETVPGKYYLSEQSLKSLLNATYVTEQRRWQDPDGVHRTVCARDHKSPTVVPECIKAGDLAGGKWDKMQDISRRVYDPNGIAPTVHCAGGGNTEPKIIAGQMQPVNRNYKADNEPRAEHFECRHDDIANAVLTGDRKNCVQIVAVRGREDEPGNGYTQRLELGSEETSNALTTVNKNNFVLEPQVLKTQRTDYGKATRKAYESHEIPGDRKAMREQVPRNDGVSNTLTTVQRDNILMEAPYITPTEAEASKTVRVGGHGVHYGHTWDTIAESVRIRKLTPWECLRLQGWKDTEIAKIRAAGISDAQMYRQAGNGITVTVLMAIFGELFGVPYAELLDGWRWDNE